MSSTDGGLDHALDRDVRTLTERLRSIVQRPEMREALFLASPGFEEVASRWAQSAGPASDRVVLPLIRYLSRMTSRATPFGLFASVSTGTVGSCTTLSLSSRSDAVRRTRIDHLVLSALAADLLLLPAVLAECPLVPSSSLHVAADRLRFVRFRMERVRRIYELAAVERTPYLEATLERARSGGTLTELAAPLMDDDITEEEAREYVLGLVSRQILVPDAGFPVTGDNPEEAFLRFLGSVPETCGAEAQFERLRTLLSGLDEGGLGHEPADYAEARTLASALGPDPGVTRLIQVDLARPSPEATLGDAVTEEVAQCLGILERLATQPHNHATELQRFAAAFSERYGDREMPLAEVLDEDVGIGYRASPEASTVHERNAPPQPGDEGRGAHPLVLRKLWAAVESGATEVSFETSEFEPLCSDTAPPLPDALVVLAVLEAESEQALARGDFRVFLRSAVGPSGASLLGRFCHLDEALRRRVERFLEDEEARHPEAVFAEVVHLPQGRVGNVVSRPVLRKYEISYMGRSGAPRERQIPLSDLLVSVREGRVFLRSMRLGCEIVPRLSIAHDFTKGSLAPYRFLGALQHQGTSPRPGWDWGSLERAPFLPRVRVGRVVLARARWRLTPDELAPIIAARGADRFRLVTELRARRRLPDRVFCIGGETALLTDFTNLLGIDAFLDEVRGRDSVELDELFPDANALCVTSPEGRFFHELVIPFLRRVTPKAGAVEALEGKARVRPLTWAPPDVFVPGSEWLTAKLYCGPAEADRILVDEVGPLVRRLVDSGAVRLWFFLRYRDPEPHLRVRLHGDPELLRSEALGALTATTEALVAQGRLRALVLDTYERETQRYGGAAAIVHAEELFFHDSEAVLGVLRSVGRDSTGDNRFRLALLGVDRLLDDMGFPLEDKLTLVEGLRDAFHREFGSEESFRRRSSVAFRASRSALQALLDGDTEGEPLVSHGHAFRVRSERSKHPAEGLRVATEAAGIRSLRSVTQSLLHMHVNRLLRSRHRKHELVLYEFLARLYRSSLARARQR